MARFRIGRSYGYAGDDEEYEVEAENLEAAEEMAWEYAVERVSSWAIAIEDNEDE